MCSSKVAIALIASIALVSAIPNLGGILGGGNNGGQGGIGGLGGILGNGENGGIGGILGNLLGNGDDNILGDLLGSLDSNGNGLGLLGNITDLPTDVLNEVTELLQSNLPIGQIISQLKELLPGGLKGLLQLVLDIVAQLLNEIVKVLSGLQPTLDQLIAIINDKDQTIEQQTQAIDALKQQNPIGLETIFFIASQLAKDLQNGEIPNVSIPVDGVPAK